ncbi:hypothetical protein ACFLYA_00645 [Candidatus Dependentiae bacterium]
MSFKKNTKNLLMISLLSSVLLCNTSTKSNITIRNEDALFIALAAGIATTIGAVYVTLKTYFAYQKGRVEYETLKAFMEKMENLENLELDKHECDQACKEMYEALEDEALELYHQQWVHPSTSLSNDYPIMWIEKDATSNRNLLAWMFFSHNLTDLSKNLHFVLDFLRHNKAFRQQRREYNKEYRKHNFRNRLLAIQKYIRNVRG